MAHVILAVLGVSLLMIVHEAGHYLMARAFGIRVTHFSIGFGPALVRWRPRRSETTFQICVVPLLAYVKMDGGDPTKEIDRSDAGLYENKSVWARALTVLGGPVANYVAASVAIFVVALTGLREPVPAHPMIVDRVEAGSAAAGAGIGSGDTILEANGVPVADVGELAAINAQRAGESTQYVVRRADGTTSTLTITPLAAGGRGVLGVVPKTETRVRQLGVGEAARLALVKPWAMTVESVRGIAELVRQRTTAGMTGPVGMVKHVAAQSEQGADAFVATLIAISIAIGFFNLLPFPFLDGGRLMFLGAEAVMRRRPNRMAEAIAHAIGLLLFLGMSALITMRDVMG